MSSVIWPKDKDRVFSRKCNFKYKENEYIEIPVEDYELEIKQGNKNDRTK